MILLALLVSFVTSIATGIVTVSLVNQAPPEVTKTINRVVEKTIERVVTEPAKQAAAVVTKETVVVKADDLVVAGIEKNAKSVVRVKALSGEGEGKNERFAGLGLVLTKDGLIASDISVAYRPADAQGNAVPETYAAIFANGAALPLTIIANEATLGVLFLKPVSGVEVKAPTEFNAPAFATGALKLGQTVVTIGGEESNTVATGIVSRLVTEAVKREATSTEAEIPTRLLAIKTDLGPSEILAGSILLNLSGEVIGMSVGGSGNARSSFVAIARILAAIPKEKSSSP